MDPVFGEIVSGRLGGVGEEKGTSLAGLFGVRCGYGERAALVRVRSFDNMEGKGESLAYIPHLEYCRRFKDVISIVRGSSYVQKC